MINDIFVAYLQIEPIISPQTNAPFVHHMVLYRCLHPNSSHMEQYASHVGDNCMDVENMPYDFIHCQSVYMVWRQIKLKNPLIIILYFEGMGDWWRTFQFARKRGNAYRRRPRNYLFLIWGSLRQSRLFEREIRLFGNEAILHSKPKAIRRRHRNYGFSGWLSSVYSSKTRGTDSRRSLPSKLFQT